MKIVTKTFLSGIVVVVCLSFLLISPPPHSQELDRAKAKVVNGVLDLSQHTLNEGPFYLDGQWQFVWGKLLSPDEWHNKIDKSLISTYKVPGNWDGGAYHETTLTGKGHATYHLVIKNPKSQTGTATLYIPFGQTSYRLLVNGIEISANGTVGTSKDTSYPESLTRRISFPLKGDETDILYQISNYHVYNGGIRKYFLIGNELDIQQHHDIRLLYSVACAAMLLFFGLYLVLLFIFRNAEKAHLYFGLTSIFLSIYTISVDTSIITIIWPSLDWHIQMRAANSSAALTLGFALIYIVYLFPKDVSLRVSQVGVVISFFIALSSFIPFINESTATYYYFTFFMVGFLLYGLGVFIKAVFNKRRGALLVLAPYILMISVTIFDIYLYQTGQEVYNMAGYGFILFMITNIYLLAKKYSDSYSEAERLEGSLRQANLMKDEFLATTSHELRTPLNGIIGLSENALENANSSQLKENLQLILANARRLAGLVSNTLDVTRLQHNDIDFLPKAVDISPIARSVMQLCHPLINNSSVKLDYRIDTSLPAILVDENHFQQILYNLIGNAIKYTPAGTITLDAKQYDNQIQISINDTGVGIAQDELTTIFEPYTQVSTNKEAVQQGIGLGLPITKKLIELNGGTIEVKSNLNKGSCFSVFLPISHETNSKLSRTEETLLSIQNDTVVESDNEITKASSLSGKTILAVDDESVNLLVLTSQLEHAGHKIITASSGTEALTCIENESIDLVLLDIMMPGMDGLEVCRRLRKEHDAAALPVILLTARSQPKDIIEGFASGANDYITKPFYRQELLARVNAALTIKDNEQLNWISAQREHAINQLAYTQHHICSMISHHGYRVINVLPDGELFEVTSTDNDDTQQTKVEYATLPHEVKEEIKKWQLEPLAYLQEFPLELEWEGNSTSWHCYGSTQLDQPMLTLLLASAAEDADIIENQKTAQTHPKMALLDLMINALACWEQETTKGKIALAEESGVWTVHIDGSTVKTRTLDKYLHLDTIPARPRWKNVTRTAQFVINSNKESHCAEELKQQLNQFYDLMKVTQF